VLVHVSNFRALKRVGDVVRVFADARARMPSADMVLRLVGDGPDRQNVVDLVMSLGLGDRVEFLGERIDLPHVLRESDLFLLPSESESFGLAALEALSCGVPVVASNVGGIPEVVTDGEVGLLGSAGDIATMAAHVVRLMGDVTLRQRFSKAARLRAQIHFPLKPMVARYLEVYRRVLAAGPAAR
jgi:N-acetyl-alpha-D-glucosaminyl L-malate synthase BshA